MAPGIWTENFKVHSYEVDFTKRARLEVMCRYFQEAAWNHAEALGLGFARLQRDNKLWVLSRLLLSVREYPLWGESVGVRTWPRRVQGAFAMRDFEFLNAAGEIIGCGSSGWLVLDANTRRPQRVDKFLANMPVTEDRRATEADPEKLAEIGTVNGEETTDSFPVRDSDIDVNEHVNNARYIGWLVDSYPHERHRQQQVRTCEINYLGETRTAEKLLVRTKPVSSVEYLHAMFNADNLEVCRGRLTWEAANSG